MKRKIFTLVTLLTMALSSTNIFANDIEINNIEEKVNVQQSNVEIPDIEQEIILDSEPKSPRSTNLVINETLSGSQGSATYSFSTSSSQPYYRIYVDNTSSSDINVTVGGNTYTVNANSHVTKIYSSTVHGRRNVDITSKDGSALSGSIAVRVASSLDELQ